MLHIYLYSFVAGLFGVNGVPHFIKGILGERHQTPFSRSSSAVVNVIWGWVNFVIGISLIYMGHVHPHLLRAFGAVALGAILMALLLAYNGSHPKQLKKE
jgi:hypothetical protein